VIDFAATIDDVSNVRLVRRVQNERGREDSAAQHDILLLPHRTVPSRVAHRQPRKLRRVDDVGITSRIDGNRGVRGRPRDIVDDLVVPYAVVDPRVAKDTLAKELPRAPRKMVRTEAIERDGRSGR